MTPALPLSARMTAAARTLRPHAGAVANARDAVLQDRAAGQDRRSAAVEQARSRGARSWTPLRPPADYADAARHAVSFYEDDTALSDQVCDYLVEGLVDGELCLVIATPGHVARIRSRLHAVGLGAIGTEQLQTFDATRLLPLLVRDGAVDLERFDRLLADVVRGHLADGRAVRAYGEMAGMLWAAGDVAAAMQLEGLWNELQLGLAFSLLCSYPIDELQGRVDDGGSEICVLHTHLAGAGA